ncbi:Zinc ABC transporter, inner membrane permease protein ZnuB [Desulfurella amilsii]|uniref:Zinc ABC transporter, inner membrane permease protein ZnuB n=1 Tax=Desulfurella amilsii TaxID=1562698 RepID=A0A1X4XZY7_9BACT|nr:metal ABC transporter permease [Desulfurella amilsii]OSS43107.1 Zinc ABC transporter, inner membrane permease protein ZnuB [Desulfurella amilsii]
MSILQNSIIVEIIFKALIVGISLSILLSILSYFVVLQRLNFLGVGISHSVFGGLAFNYLFGLTTLFLPIGFACLTALLIGILYRKGLSKDSAINVMFVFTMALGAIVLSFSSGYSANILGMLFGDILAINNSDIVYSLILLAIGLILFSIFFSHVQLITFNEELARINGINVDLFYYLFLIFLGIIIVLSVKLIGIILVNAFLVLPTLCGMNVARNYKNVILWSIAFSIVSCVFAIFISYYLNTPSGATIVITFFVFWLFSLIYNKIARRIK